MLVGKKAIALMALGRSNLKHKRDRNVIINQAIALIYGEMPQPALGYTFY